MFHFLQVDLDAMDADEQEEAGELQGGLWQYEGGPAEAREKHASTRRRLHAHASWAGE